MVAASKVVSSRPDMTWELLIVDNGSSDNTQEVIGGFADCLPIRTVMQPVPGLSNARNAGIDNATGAFLLWTDDDVLVDENWLVSYLQAFLDHPDTGLFGGRAVPRYLEPVTVWFTRNETPLSSLLAIRDATDWTEIVPGRLPFGLNYAVRADVQGRHRYDPDLGVAPGRRIGGEESDMMCAALAEGVTGRWVWDATVFHLIPPERQSAAYIFNYYRSQGFLYPKCQVSDKTGFRSALALGTTLANVARKGALAFFRRRSRGSNWVSGYADYARWVGTLDRIRRKDEPSR